MLLNILENTISDFVAEITKERDHSHGWLHMKRVSQNAKVIMTDIDITEKQYENALIVSWLHDVADHKYDEDGKLKKRLEEFLKTIIKDPDRGVRILQCIDMISFSKEVKRGYKYYEKILPPEWVTVRNIASDADKLEALGPIGIDRCKYYYLHESKGNITYGKIIRDIYNLAKIKLLLLKDNYIHTKRGKQIAEPLHDFLEKWLIINKKYIN